MTTPAPPLDDIVRSSFSSVDESEITAFIGEQYVGSSLRLSAFGDGGHFSAAHHDLPAIGAGRVWTSISYSGTSAEGFTDLVSVSLRSGVVEMACGGSTAVTTSQGVALYPIGIPVHVSEGGFDATTLRLSLAAVQRRAEEDVGVPAHQLRFLGMEPVSASMARYWRSLVALVGGAMSDPDSPLASPLLVEELVRTVATAALHVFPNTTLTRQHVPGPGATAPAAVRRAVDHIEAHAHEPLQLTAIAAAAGTSARSLQVGFRQHLGTTPLGHVRRVRLELARRELQGADPEGGERVAAVAARWGFSNAGRFTAAYRDAFGESPVRTLRGARHAPRGAVVP